MSVPWTRPGTRHLCGHPRCRRLQHAAIVLFPGAYVALALLLTTTSPVLWISMGAACMAGAWTALLWPHPRAGDPGIEAIADATRESPLPAVADFELWRRELEGRRRAR
jgi:hypothetical protein